ncbi:MAG: YciI family protein [Candidatus Eremiobacteraeota bacterium]|nr:YciI family protein [Candidatus Eremiobacteraeota bacterium]
MRFMVLMIPGDRKFEEGAMPDQKDIAAMMKYNEELANAGVLLAVDGLHPTSKGARIRFAGGKRTITDGPFTEARELIGGYWLWQVKSKAEALEWASRCPAAEGDTLEIRQVFEPSEFGPEVAKAEGALMSEIGKRADANKKNAK